MKKILITLAMLLLAAPAFAQHGGSGPTAGSGFDGGGLAVGYSYSSPLYTWTLDGNALFQVSDNDNLGFALGIGAGIADSGTGNTAIGNGALSSVTTGNTNMAIGKVAMEQLTTGTFNTAIGNGALRYITTTSENTAIGGHAMFDVNFSGTGNTAIGSQAALEMENGAYNTAVGGGALYSGKSVQSSVAVGSFALYFTTGDGNVGIGRNSGRDNTTGGNNTYVGTSAGYGSTGAALTNATAIGYLAQVATSNTVALGNTSVTDILAGTSAQATVRASAFAVPLVADATVQFGQTVMPDASADGRFDVTTGSATLSIGVLGGVGPSTAASTYPVITSGLAYVAQNEDVAVTRGHFLIQSATAGYCDDSATVTTIGLNIAKALYSEAVSAVIDNAGCTGSAGCINTALNTPNTGPAGQITLGVDVAALGWTAGQPVIFWNSGGTDPTGLTDGKVYFLASVATVNVTISATYGGAVVVPSDQGDDPTQYLARLPRSVLSIQ